MNATRIRIIVAGTFALALLGGAAAGLLAARFSLPLSGVQASAGTTAHAQPISLADLRLSAQQREQIRHIWEEVRGVSDECYTQAQQLNQQKDDKVLALLDDRQRKQYEQIYRDYSDHYTRLMAKRERTLKKAIDQTKELLSESQRQTYDEILASRLGPAHGSPAAAP